jgi:hypothetical protein
LAGILKASTVGYLSVHPCHTFVQNICNIDHDTSKLTHVTGKNRAFQIFHHQIIKLFEKVMQQESSLTGQGKWAESSLICKWK